MRSSLESLEPTVRSIAATMPLLLYWRAAHQSEHHHCHFGRPRQNVGSIFVGQDIEMWREKRFNLLQAIRRSLLDAVNNDDEFRLRARPGEQAFQILWRVSVGHAVPGIDRIECAIQGIAGRRIYDARSHRIALGNLTALQCRSRQSPAGGARLGLIHQRSHSATAALAPTLRMRLTICLWAALLVKRLICASVSHSE